MRTAIVLLLLLTIACILGSVIPQGELEAYYTGYYSGTVARLILLAQVDDVFHSWWFVVITAALCINLLGCNLLRFPVLIRQMKEGYTAEKRMRADDSSDSVCVSDAEKLFQRLHFSKTETLEAGAGRKFLYGVRNKGGIWGAWLTHLGMLIIILGFSLGQIFTEKYSVYGVAGETLPVEGTSFEVTINDFRTILREDETVEQYVSDLTLTDTESGDHVTDETSVNHPMEALGMKLYQNSTGWAAHVAVARGEKLIQSEILCAGEHLTVADMPDLVLAFNAFYPDYVEVDGKPATASSALNNPAYLYTLYYQGRVLGMNVLKDGQPITVDDLSVVFMEPQQYTLIQLKSDPFTWLTLVGGVLILAGLFLSFYLRTEELWARELEDGSWRVSGYSRKGGILFQERILEMTEELTEGDKKA